MIRANALVAGPPLDLQSRFLGTLTYKERPDPSTLDWDFTVSVLAWIVKQEQPPGEAALGIPQFSLTTDKANNGCYGNLNCNTVIAFNNLSRYQAVQEPVKKNDSDLTDHRVLDTNIGMYIRSCDLKDLAGGQTPTFS